MLRPPTTMICPSDRHGRLLLGVTDPFMLATFVAWASEMDAAQPDALTSKNI